MRHDGRSLLVAIALAACGGAKAAPGPELQITGESTKVRRGEPLPATSPFFDGARVTLRAARGETLGLIVWRRDDAATTVGLALDAPGVAVTGFEISHQRVRSASTRMYGPSRGAGEWPDRLTAASPSFSMQRAGAFEVAVSAQAVPGTVTGTLAVGEERFPVTLVIDAVTLPPIDEARHVGAYYDEREVARAAGAEVGSEAAIAAEGRLAEVFRRHGVAAAPDLWLDQWDTRGAQLRGLPWVPVYLPDDDVEAAATVRAWIARLAGSGQVPFAIPIDEPRDAATRQRVRALADVAREAGSGPGRFLFAVTDQPQDVYGDAVDIFLSPYGLTRERDATPERWTYNGGPPFAGCMIVDTDGTALRTWGWIAWRWRVPLWYIWDAAYWSDRHNHKRRGGKGLPPPGDLDADATTFDDGDDHGALDGVLVYPAAGGTVSPSLRLVALRRGLQDRLLLERLEACAGRPAAEAIAAALVPTALGDAGKPGAARPGSWPRDEAAWEAARLQLLDAIAGCAP